MAASNGKDAIGASSLNGAAAQGSSAQVGSGAEGQAASAQNQDAPEYIAQASSAARDIKEPTTPDQVQAIIDDMAAYYESGATRDAAVRIRQLAVLEKWLVDHEDEVLDALHADLGKSRQEGYETELGLVLDEIRLMKRKLRCWAAPKPVATPLMHFPATTRIYAQPYGVVAILAPWNYPVQLTLVPLVDAIAAGNVVLVKPSHTSAHTGRVLERLIGEAFDPRYVRCLFNLPNLNDNMLKMKVDFVFFTGSPHVGHEIMHACANNLTPLVLELGGKSPTFVDKNADLQRAGQRIAWGKCLNSGQTCVGPDYILAHESVVDELVKWLGHYIREYFGNDILRNKDYPHMISRHHFERVCGLIDNINPDARVVFGGGRDPESLRIEPTIITGVTLDDPVMGQEIFGPVLPILTWKTPEEALSVPKHFGHPLACYIFSNDKGFQQQIVERQPYGGGCINDVVIHVATNKAGFGGFGNSGLGEYHGKRGFDAFTHYKTVVNRRTFCELPIRNAPFEPWKLDIIKKLLK